ncbi:MAG: serine/threonine protein kinase [Gemmataceae bacterium]|nr:serine/threonine protein kinase [Gemmataceae bacterium]
MERSVEDFCNLLVRSQLLPPLEIRNLRKRWHSESGGGGADALSQWLVGRHVLTPYQASLLQRGKAEHLVLNEYRILDRIGQGRMAAVYKAAHTNGQIVALKILPPSRAKDPEAFGRFQREARLALKLKHPNVIRAFQVGQCAGLHYIVMEYLEGESLEDLLQRRAPLPVDEVVRILDQALQGLQHIHEQGMVHRDLKPSNLMLVPGAMAGRMDTTLHATVKILDMGLGRALFDEGAPPEPRSAGLTELGSTIGMPEYQAPEQARDAHTADIRADIYSLGCVAYRCLTGRPPFTAETSVQLLVLHSTVAPPPLQQFNLEVPEEVGDVVLQMLAKDPAQRFATPWDAAQAFQVFLPDGTEPAAPGSEQTSAGVPVGILLPNPATTPALAAAPEGPAQGGIASTVGRDVELVPVAVPATAAPARMPWTWSRNYLFGAAGYGLGVLTALIINLIGWKLVLGIVFAVLVGRWLIRRAFTGLKEAIIREALAARMPAPLTPGPLPAPAPPTAVLVNNPAAPAPALK